MAHDVFISYSHEDKAIADAICHKLESVRIWCWIAPRDILPDQKALSRSLDSRPYPQHGFPIPI